MNPLDLWGTITPNGWAALALYATGWFTLGFITGRHIQRRGEDTRIETVLLLARAGHAAWCNAILQPGTPCDCQPPQTPLLDTRPTKGLDPLKAAIIHSRAAVTAADMEAIAKRVKQTINKKVPLPSLTLGEAAITGTIPRYISPHLCDKDSWCSRPKNHSGHCSRNLGPENEIPPSQDHTPANPGPTPLAEAHPPCTCNTPPNAQHTPDCPRYPYGGYHTDLCASRATNRCDCR